MNIKKNDKVKILSGKDKGKIGKVLQVFAKEEKASIEGLNLLVKHLRPRKQNEKGQRIEFPAPMSLSNLMLICSKCGKPTRVGAKTLEINQSGKIKKTKTRFCQRCKQAID